MSDSIDTTSLAAAIEREEAEIKKWISQPGGEIRDDWYKILDAAKKWDALDKKLLGKLVEMTELPPPPPITRPATSEPASVAPDPGADEPNRDDDYEDENPQPEPDAPDPGGGWRYCEYEDAEQSRMFLTGTWMDGQVRYARGYRRRIQPEPKRVELPNKKVFTTNEVAKAFGVTNREASNWFDNSRLGYHIPDTQSRRFVREKLVSWATANGYEVVEPEPKQERNEEDPNDPWSVEYYLQGMKKEGQKQERREWWLSKPFAYYGETTSRHCSLTPDGIYAGQIHVREVLPDDPTPEEVEALRREQDSAREQFDEVIGDHEDIIKAKDKQIAELKADLDSKTKEIELVRQAANNVIDTYGIPESHSLHDRVLLLGQKWEKAEAERDKAFEDRREYLMNGEPEEHEYWGHLNAEVVPIVSCPFSGGIRLREILEGDPTPEEVDALRRERDEWKRCWGVADGKLKAQDVQITELKAKFNFKNNLTDEIVRKDVQIAELTEANTKKTELIVERGEENAALRARCERMRNNAEVANMAKGLLPPRFWKTIEAALGQYQFDAKDKVKRSEWQDALNKVRQMVKEPNR